MLSKNRTAKQIALSKTKINWVFNDIWCYLFIACFEWKIGFFQQTVVRGYYIFNLHISLTGLRKYINLIIKTKIRSDLSVQKKLLECARFKLSILEAFETVWSLSSLCLIQILHKVGTNNVMDDIFTVRQNCNIRLNFYQGNSQVVAI